MRCASSLMYEMPKSESSSRRHRSHRHRRRSPSAESEDRDDASLRKRRVEKLSKKVVKHLKKHHVATEGYGVADNRFQDPNLHERFIWNKKIEKQLASGVSVKDLDARAERERQHQRLDEIEKAKRSREERETERARQQEELSMIERARLAAEAASAIEKEEDFLLQQALASSRIRIESDRMRPIDALVRALLPELCWGQMEPAYKILQKMNVDELNALMTEIQEFKSLDCQDASHVEYWSCMESICEYELNLAKKQETKEEQDGLQLPSGFTRERQFYVEDEIQNMLTGKSLSELVQLEAEIGDLLTSDSIDPDYWTRVLENLKLEKLKTKIRSIQSTLQKTTLDDAAPLCDTQEDIDAKRNVEEVAECASSDNESGGTEIHEECPSPEPCASFDGKDVVAEEEDNDHIALLRRQVQLQYSETFKKRAKEMPAASCSMGTEAPLATDPDEATFHRLKSAAISYMGSDEGYLPFGGEVELESHVYWWHEKYRPRKPKYFNRVHTGYEWNKYNQTHYDHDNPPPKVVQGYKFNIFYPDLIDKKTPPYYEIENDPDAKDSATCWLKFKAGPPYEDLAFRIVNKEWEYSHKKGFKCTFERGILHLYFNFKRQRYRR